MEASVYGRNVWHYYCDAFGDGIRDPARSSLSPEERWATPGGYVAKPQLELRPRSFFHPLLLSSRAVASWKRASALGWLLGIAWALKSFETH